MSPEEIRELWSRLLSGAALSAQEQKDLVQALDADAELRDSLIENLQLDGMLRALDTTRRNGEAFVRTLTECVGAEHDATRFVEKVELRLNEGEPPPPADPAGTGRRTKPPTTRVFLRRAAVSGQGETAWKPALIAAAALVVILLLVTSPKPAPHVAKVPPKPPTEIVPVPPVPEQDPAPLQDPPRPEAPKSNEDLRPPSFAPPPPAPKPEERPRTTLPEERPAPTAPKPESPKSTTETLPPAIIVQATLDKVEGNVYLARTPADKPRGRKGEKIAPGWTVETPGATSGATIVFSDDTSVELGPNSSFREEPPIPGQGRRVVLLSGSLRSKISKQPADRPMVFVTPTAEATIVGTTIRLTIHHDGKEKSTTLEVEEGKVLFTKIQEKRPVEVLTGQFAVAAAGSEPAPHKSFPDETLVKFGPADLKPRAGWVIDSGEEFDAKRGYGWKGPKNGPIVPGLKWRDPATGQMHDKRSGRLAVRRTTSPTADPLKSTDVTAGWAGQSETWTMPVPNGRYLVSVCCGDISYEQGPHHVWVEGVQLIDAKRNKAGELIEVKDVPVEVRDGELTMRVGGYAGTKVSSDGSSDTLINYLSIKKIRK